MMTCREKAGEWGISTRTVNQLCKSGKIPGAVKNGKSWAIPDDAARPADGRVISGKYMKDSASKGKKPLPVGISDYVRAQSEYYYVDKTLLIRDFLDRKAYVSLFTRPRRFGKTLNMDMLRVFFEISEEDTSRYFKDKKIWKCGTKYTEHQGKYPVIFLSFKDVKFDSWEATCAKIAELLQEEFGRHSELKDSERLEKYEREYYEKVLEGKANEVELSASLQKLSKMLSEHYGKAPVIIIDEYDTPIQEAYIDGFWDEMTGFVRNLFNSTFKTNRYLERAVLTGITRISKESIFSDLNNIKVDTVTNSCYSNDFGFTEEEVKTELDKYGYKNSFTEVKKWYDGFRIGEISDIYNPWSVTQYLDRGVLDDYWANTSENSLVDKLIKEGSADVKTAMESLLKGESVEILIDEEIVFNLVDKNESGIFSLLLAAGYIRADNVGNGPGIRKNAE